MMLSVDLGGEIGTVNVVTTSHRGHSPEELAEMAAARIVSVSENAPEPIRTQAHAFRQQVVSILTVYMRQAQKSERTNIVATLEAQGLADVADGIRRL